MEFSMETPDQEKARLAALEIKNNPAVQPTLVDGAKSAMPNLYPDHKTNPGSALLAATNDPDADPAKLAEITAAADEKYIVKSPVKPLDDGHLQAKWQAEQNAIASTRLLNSQNEWAKEHETYLNEFNSDPEFRLGEKIKNINNTVGVISDGLLSDIDRAEKSPSKQVEVLAGKDPLYFVRDSISSLSLELNKKNPSRSVGEIEQSEKKLYLEKVRDSLVRSGVKKSIAEIITNDSLTKSEKTTRLKELIR
jgi:hypothetical protein